MKKDCRAVIGTAGLTKDTIAGEPGFEISWFVLPEYQNRGFATEITAELLRHAFAKLGAERVVAETHPDNPASNRVLKKLGFICLGLRHHTYDDLPGFDTQVLWEQRADRATEDKNLMDNAEVPLPSTVYPKVICHYRSPIRVFPVVTRLESLIIDVISSFHLEEFHLFDLAKV